MPKTPKWTAECQEWYERWLERLAAELPTYVWERGHPWAGRRLYADDEIPHMIAWYRARPLEFCYWQEPLDRDFYPNNPFDNDASIWRTFFSDEGHWKLNWDRLREARAKAHGAIWYLIREERNRRKLEEECQRFPSFDAWLAALITGQLRARVEYAPHEDGTWSYLNAGGRKRLEAMRRRLRERWPRACRGCGAEFLIGARTANNTAYCDICRAARKGVTA